MTQQKNGEVLGKTSTGRHSVFSMRIYSVYVYSQNRFGMVALYIFYKASNINIQSERSTVASNDRFWFDFGHYHYKNIIFLMPEEHGE